MIANGRKINRHVAGLPTAAALKLAMAAIDRGDYPEGRAALEQILEREPNNAAAWFWMGYCEDDVRARDACFDRVRDRAKRPGYSTW